MVTIDLKSSVRIGEVHNYIPEKTCDLACLQRDTSLCLLSRGIKGMLQCLG